MNKGAFETDQTCHQGKLSFKSYLIQPKIKLVMTVPWPLLKKKLKPPHVVSYVDPFYRTEVWYLR